MSVTQEIRTEGRRITVRTVILIVLAVMLTVFAVMNRLGVSVWPFGMMPMFMVIFISFALGAGIGWLAKSILGRNSGR